MKPNTGPRMPTVCKHAEAEETERVDQIQFKQQATEKTIDLTEVSPVVWPDSFVMWFAVADTSKSATGICRMADFDMEGLKRLFLTKVYTIQVVGVE